MRQQPVAVQYYAMGLPYFLAVLADQEALKLILDKFGQGAMLNAT